MQYRLLGSSGLRVSELCLGTMTFGEEMARLTAANALFPRYPHTFWNDFVRRDLIFGERVDKLQMRG